MIPYHKAKVLIVGDSREGTESLQELLRRDGYRHIRQVSDPDHVIDAFQDIPPDLIVFDLDATGKHGTEILDRLGMIEVKADPSLAILVLSGEADRATCLRLLGGGAKDFLTKPFGRAEFLNRARNLVETRLFCKDLQNRFARQEESLAAAGETESQLRDALSESKTRNAAKADFLANFSHELRTPLTAILGFSEILKNETFGPHGSPKYGEYAANIHESGRYLLSLIDDILDYSKAEAGKLDLDIEEIDVRDVLDATMRMFSEQAKASGIQLKLDVAADFPQLRTDERRLRQVLSNLVSNAVKFTPKGGRVTIRAGVNPADGAFIIVVSDTGVGLDPKDIEVVLAPYGQVDSPGHKKKGTGLGMPLTKRIVEALGGTLEIRSRKGVGTAVTVRFPSSMIVR